MSRIGVRRHEFVEPPVNFVKHSYLRRRAFASGFLVVTPGLEAQLGGPVFQREEEGQQHDLAVHRQFEELDSGGVDDVHAADPPCKRRPFSRGVEQSPLAIEVVIEFGILAILEFGHRVIRPPASDRPSEVVDYTGPHASATRRTTSRRQGGQDGRIPDEVFAVPAFFVRIEVDFANRVRSLFRFHLNPTIRHVRSSEMLFAYIGPETMWPVASIIAAVSGVFMMFGRNVVAYCRGIFRRIAPGTPRKPVSAASRSASTDVAQTPDQAVAEKSDAAPTG